MLKQTRTLTALGLSSLTQRLGSSLVVVIGMAGVVGIFLAVLMMSTSLRHTVEGAADPKRAIVMSKNAESEGASFLQPAEVATIQNAPGIARSAEGVALASAETFATVGLRKRSDRTRGEIVIRGVPPIALVMRKEVKIVSGRAMEPGLHEMIVGRSVQREYEGLEVGAKVFLRGALWTVVGVFEADGSLRESEIWADATTLMSAFKRTSFNAVTVELSSPSAFTAFRDSLTSNPALTVEVLREITYLERQSKELSTLLSMIAYLVGAIMSLGAVFGAANSMYSAVSARSVEIATLRALGFGPASVVGAVMVEALLLAVVGAALGVLCVWLIMSGQTFDTRLSGGQVAAQLQLSSSIVVGGLSGACLIALLGGLFPALRAARQPIVAALREH